MPGRVLWAFNRLWKRLVSGSGLRRYLRLGSDANCRCILSAPSILTWQASSSVSTDTYLVRQSPILWLVCDSAQAKRPAISAARLCRWRDKDKLSTPMWNSGSSALYTRTYILHDFLLRAFVLPCQSINSADRVYSDSISLKHHYRFLYSGARVCTK